MRSFMQPKFPHDNSVYISIRDNEQRYHGAPCPDEGFGAVVDRSVTPDNSNRNH